ncbi:MAG: GNAT family N-acetyltransferase [Actinomycetota bacterium]
MISAVAPADEAGIGVLAETARTAVVAAGGPGEVAAVVIRLLGEDATRRLAGGEERAELELTVGLDGTEVIVSLADRGEPVSGAPSVVLALVDLGLATASDGRITGGGNLTEVRLPLPAHGVLLDDSALEVIDEDVALSDAPVTMVPIGVEHAAALTRAVYRCYGWTYPGPALYYPERIAAQIERGERIGEVAVTEEGEVAAHWGAVYVADGVVETGGTVTDPRFRRRGLANRLGERLLERLGTSGVRGRMREPVLTHPATQHIALREGAHIVGVHLHDSAPLQQVGITDGVQAHRTSLTVMYGPLLPLAPAELHVPTTYEPILRTLLAPTDWPREIVVARPSRDRIGPTVLGSRYDSLNRAGRIEVVTVGDNLVDAVDAALTSLRTAGAEVVRVHLPANQPALATAGAGLGTLGLAFASFVPEFGGLGDLLALQWLADTEVDTTDFRYADAQVEALAVAIVAQVAELGDQDVKLRRRLARRQQLLAALPGDD